MKKLLISSWTFFTIGLLFRLFHFYGASIILMLGTLLMLVHSVIYFAKNLKSNLPNCFHYLSFAFITIYLLFRLQYWSCGPFILGFPLLFIFVLLLTFSTIVILITTSFKINLSKVLLVLYFVFFLILSFIHSHSIFYFFNLNTTLNGESANTNYKYWDKYSWFLYIAGEQEKAIKANKNAIQSAEKYLKSNPNQQESEYLLLIKKHENEILNKKWSTWP